MWRFWPDDGQADGLTDGRTRDTDGRAKVKRRLFRMTCFDGRVMDKLKRPTTKLEHTRHGDRQIISRRIVRLIHATRSADFKLNNFIFVFFSSLLSPTALPPPPPAPYRGGKHYMCLCVYIHIHNVYTLCRHTAIARDPNSTTAHIFSTLFYFKNKKYTHTHTHTCIYILALQNARHPLLSTVAAAATT